MFDFFEEIQDLLNSFINLIKSAGASTAMMWEQFRDSEIFKLLARFKDTFPQPVSWAIFIVIFTTFLEFTRRGR